MNARVYEQWLAANKAVLAPIARWQELAAEAAQKLVQHNLALSQDYVELGNRQLQLLGEVREPQKLAAEGGKLASEFGQKLVDRTGDFVKVAKETQDAVAQWADQTVKSGFDVLYAATAKPN